MRKALGLLLAIALYAPGSAARADYYSFSWVEAEIPASLLPPGPAEATLEPFVTRPGELVHRLRVEVKAGQPTRLRLYYRHLDVVEGRLEAAAQIVVTSASGARWVGPPAWPARTTGRIFVGSADAFATWSRHAGEAYDGGPAEPVHGEPDPIASTTVVTPGDLGAKGCALLLETSVAIIQKSPLPSAALLDCAARGARLALVGRELAGELARFAPGRPLPWGNGWVSWVPSVESGGATPYLRNQPLDSLHVNVSTATSGWEPVTEDRLLRGRSVVLGLLAFYVALLGVVGFLVARRPRRPWVAWSWLPAVVLATTATLALAGSRWNADQATLILREVAVLAPTGRGLLDTNVEVRGVAADVYTIDFPWHGGSLSSAERPFRFGSPIGRSAGPLVLREDEPAGRLTVGGVAVNRLGSAKLRAQAPVARPVARLERRGRELWAVNPTARPLEHLAACTKDGWLTWPALAAGEARRLELGPRTTESELLDAAQTAPPHERILLGLFRHCGELPADAYMLAVLQEKADANVLTTPALRQNRLAAEIVLAPLGEGGAP